MNLIDGQQPLGRHRRLSQQLSWMGFSVRSRQWRYTLWLPWNGTDADWVAAAITDSVCCCALLLTFFDKCSLLFLDRG